MEWTHLNSPGNTVRRRKVESPTAFRACPLLCHQHSIARKYQGTTRGTLAGWSHICKPILGLAAFRAGFAARSRDHFLGIAMQPGRREQLVDGGSR